MQQTVVKQLLDPEKWRAIRRPPPPLVTRLGLPASMLQRETAPGNPGAKTGGDDFNERRFHQWHFPSAAVRGIFGGHPDEDRDLLPESQHFF